MASIDYFSYTPTQDYAGRFHIVSEQVTLLAGQVYPAGSAIGVITAAGPTLGLSVESLPGATDGSQNIYGVLPYEVDATLSNQGATLNISGEFATEYFVFGAAVAPAVAYTPATAEANLRANGKLLFIKGVIDALNTATAR